MYQNEPRLPAASIFKSNDVIKTITSDFHGENSDESCYMRKHSKDSGAFGWCLYILDVHTKFLYEISLQTKQAASVMSSIIQTDNRNKCGSERIKQACVDYIISFITLEARHPQKQNKLRDVIKTIILKLAINLRRFNLKRWFDLY
ncbi:hypothetical protein CWI38_0406p0020 [Hamiltosporidium tvaerminnensis]|uniref:Uncharacterized protein n=1 Tax=Hamiltosporidium tvaerminnensis TaxID=1176355 RepID=A0A4Q9LXK4_9MICR|nr:hypothetical protein CWI38_0406p0020 [Hamiltosporidium tvaerminnensis]